MRAEERRRGSTRLAMLLSAAGLLAAIAAGAACGEPDQAAAPSPTAASEIPASPSPQGTPSPQTSPSPSGEPTASPPPATPRISWQALEDGGYRSWERAPGWPGRKTTDSPHSLAKEIFVNAAVVQALGSGATRFPAGATIVKPGFDAAGNLAIVAAMQRLPGEGWRFAEYRADGSVIARGDNIALCTQCHQGGSDGVLAFTLD